MTTVTVTVTATDELLEALDEAAFFLFDLGKDEHGAQINKLIAELKKQPGPSGYLMRVAGQGDEYIAFIEDERVWSWAVTEATPGRAGNESSWEDTALRDIFELANACQCSAGSYVNDRVLYLICNDNRPPGVTVFFERDDFDAWVEERKPNIIESFDGYIY